MATNILTNAFLNINKCVISRTWMERCTQSIRSYAATKQETDDKKKPESKKSEAEMKTELIKLLKTSPYKKTKAKFVLQGIDLTKYTHHPLPYPKTGGRNWYGRVENRRMSGGEKHQYIMIDPRRPALSPDVPLVEKVLKVINDPLRSSDIALVAFEDHKRWIIATRGMKKGDLITTSHEIPTLRIRAVDGNSYPVGALVSGTMVHNVEKVPEEGGHFARAAGVSCVITRKIDDRVVLKIPSGREIMISEKCMATVGVVSNEKTPIGSPNRMRRLGIKQRSGLRKKKTGYHGRKINPKPPMVRYEKDKRSIVEMFNT